jgi:hypothetical protein
MIDPGQSAAIPNSPMSAQPTVAARTNEAGRAGKKAMPEKSCGEI